ncbi:hypothetical protein PF003_g34865 [Phytophthora fragariae]|nr:hypothetical protein PF003_g34865 [Phytophthora fragariae]
MHRALTIVAFVLRHQADADALQELNEVVSNFIGPDPNLSLAAACSLGSTRLLNWIWNASAASKEERTSRWTLGNYLRSEPKYHQWQFQKAVGWQSQEGNAASSGRLEILKFLLEHDAGRNCTHMRVKTPIGGENVVHWSSRSIVNAIEKGHKDIAKWLYQQVPHESSTDDIQMIVESSLAAGYIDLANLVLPPDRNILECAPFCPRPEIVEMALETAYFPLNKSSQKSHQPRACASNQQTLVGFLSGPDDKIAVEWAVQQNPNYAMLLPVNDEPVATIHR